MRFLATTIMMLSLTCLAIANGRASDPGIKQTCGGTGHTHQYSDIRIAAIEVTRVEECGFSYVDLEENTVGLDNHFSFDSGFEIIQVAKKAEKSGEFHMLGATRKDVRKGMRGVAVYCMGCRAVISLRPLSGNEIAIRGWRK